MGTIMCWQITQGYPIGAGWLGNCPQFSACLGTHLAYFINLWLASVGTLLTGS